jgi:hypothetical protein
VAPHFELKSRPGAKLNEEGKRHNGHTRYLTSDLYRNINMKRKKNVMKISRMILHIVLCPRTSSTVPIFRFD